MGGTWVSKGAVKTNSGKATLVVRLRVALPPRAQTERNSVTDAVTNCEFDLEDIVECERVNHWWQDNLVNLDLMLLITGQGHISEITR